MELDFDVAGKIGAVQRRVENRDHAGQPARVVVAGRTYETSIDKAWDAITNPERIPRWFLPISGDLRLGGRYQLEGNAGGEITKCEPPRHLAVTWEFARDISWVNVTLEEDDSGNTLLELEHIMYVPENDLFWQEYGPGGAGVGWDPALLGLDIYLSTPDAVAPEDVMKWLQSDEGVEFVHQSSDAWCRASIEYGTPPEAAWVAADRTKAFYTGAGPEPEA